MSKAKEPRKLSHKQATRCENARLNTACLCRCQGKFHGAGRVKDVAELKAGDPHQVSAEEPKKARKKR